MDVPTESQVGGAGEAAHFCKPPSEEEVQSWKAHWRAQHAETHPQPPPPPMANVSLAMELAGDGVRGYEFRGQRYQVEPTTVAAGFALQRVQEGFRDLQGLEQLTGEQELTKLRDCYATIAEIGWAHLTPRPAVNPFLTGEQVELHLLFVFLLSSGDETPPLESQSDALPRRWNAAHYLMAYEATFGPATTWRRFCAGLACLRRLEAERALLMFSAMACAQGGGDTAKQWLDAQTKAARS